jgi:iron complex outermembrane receptor protein
MLVSFHRSFDAAGSTFEQGDAGSLTLKRAKLDSNGITGSDSSGESSVCRARSFCRIASLLLLVAILSPAAAHGQQSEQDLESQSLEQLMTIQVTSASKEAEKLSTAPAAIFVITGDDIRRGGFTSIPDALRIVPGLHVAQQSAHVWQVAARGFSSVFNHDMLVLIDGRLVYTPLFGGVWWDVQDPIMEDIDRIEVIRGPGGTLWGADAVNGVINIILKEAAKTQGALTSASAGVNDGYQSVARYGGAFGKFNYRLYGSSAYWLPSVDAAGHDNYDDWSISQGGLRVDWNRSAKDVVTFDGQGYSGRTRDTLSIFSPTAPPVSAHFDSVMKGGHVLGHWTHQFNERSGTDLLGYCDWTDRNEEGFIEPRNICDLEFQHNYSITHRQAVIWGGGVMSTRATEEEDFTTSFVPQSQRETTANVFLQYDLALVPNRLRVIVGSKFEHDTYVGFQYQPQIRAVWTPQNAHTVWAAISRVVRMPTASERDLLVHSAEVSVAPPTFLLLDGNPNLQSEVEYAYEAGYRYQWRERLSFDGAIYYNDFDRLIGNSEQAPVVHSSPLYIDLPLLFQNLGSGQTHGMELYLSYTPFERWTISTGINALRGNSVGNIIPGAGDGGSIVGGDPREQVSLQSKLDLTRYLNFDTTYYYDDSIPQALAPVNRVDVGLSTRPIHQMSFSVWGRNLQSDRHQEALGFVLPAGQIRRSVVFQLTWQQEKETAGRNP